MAVINIDDAYILNETGAQVDKVTGLYFKDESTSAAEKAFAQLNIGTAGSNRNMFDNPWFTVRQRGDGPFSANAPAVDRWRTTNNATITATENGITLTTTVRTWGMVQRVAKGFFTVGKTYTISAMEQDGTITSASFEWTGNAISRYVTGANVGFEISVSSSAYEQIYITTNYTGDVYLKAVKLELGSVSTLANDAPPELSIARIPCYENHLRLKGQYAPVGYAIALSTTLALLAIPTPVPMRIAPTPSLSGTLYFNAGTPFAITSVQNPTLGVNQVMIQVVGTFDTGKVYLAQFRDANSYLDLSADL